MGIGDGLSRRELLQSGVVLISGLVCQRFSLAGAGTLTNDGTEESWRIGNELIRREVTFRLGVGLFTRQLSSIVTQKDLLGASMDVTKSRPEFAFLCDGQECNSNGGVFALIGFNEAKTNNSRTLQIQLKHIKLPLEVTAVYTIYEAHAASRKHLLLKNTGDSPLKITRLRVETLELSLGPENEMTLLAQYGAAPREIFYTGRSEDAGLLLTNGRTGDGIAILNEAPGYMKRTEIGGWDAADRISVSMMYDTDLMPFERIIAPGEEFETANASLVLFRSGDGFNDPRWRVPSYSAEVLERRIDHEGPSWIYNTWEPFERDINHDICLELIDAAGAMGMDIFTVDDGWQQEYGENAVNLNAFPGGLDPILRAVEAKGMRLGLWIPVAAIGTTTDVHKAHPEWASRNLDGTVKRTGTAAGEKVVMCMASPFWHTAAQRINDAIERFRLAYAKLDLTTIFNAYGEAPGCWAKGHDHADWAESLHRIYERIRNMTGAVYAKHPHVLLDLTFELWGQKHVIDAGLLAAGDLDWMSNVDDRQSDSAGPLQARQLLYARASSMPVEAMLIGNLHADLPSIQESFATAIGSAPLLLGDLRNLSAMDRAWFGEKIGWFKQFRKQVKLSDSFFPLGSWKQTSPAAWDGFARLDRSGEGVVVLFRNKSGVSHAQVALPLMPEGRYRVRSVMNRNVLRILDRTAWTKGVEVRFTGQVELLELQHV
jgi:alpha-galactosidase